MKIFFLKYLATKVKAHIFAEKIREYGTYMKHFLHNVLLQMQNAVMVAILG